MKVLGVIPARGGSKGIPNKNLIPLAGKPLLVHTCEQALSAKSLTRVIVSTDSKEIASCAQRHGVEVPFLRPAKLAADGTPMLAVLRHAVKAVSSARPDVVVLLQPTSPLRKASHIDSAVRLLIDSKADSVVSVIPVPHQFLAPCQMEIKNGRLLPLPGKRTALQRQDKPARYARNGPAVLAVWRLVLEEKGLYGSRCVPLIMEPLESVDIDSMADLKIAEALLEKR